MLECYYVVRAQVTALVVVLWPPASPNCTTNYMECSRNGAVTFHVVEIWSTFWFLVSISILFTLRVRHGPATGGAPTAHGVDSGQADCCSLGRYRAQLDTSELKSANIFYELSPARNAAYVLNT